MDHSVDDGWKQYHLLYDEYVHPVLVKCDELADVLVRRDVAFGVVGDDAPTKQDYLDQLVPKYIP